MLWAQAHTPVGGVSDGTTLWVIAETTNNTLQFAYNAATSDGSTQCSDRDVTLPSWQLVFRRIGRHLPFGSSILTNNTDTALAYNCQLLAP